LKGLLETKPDIVKIDGFFLKKERNMLRWIVKGLKRLDYAVAIEHVEKAEDLELAKKAWSGLCPGLLHRQTRGVSLKDFLIPAIDLKEGRLVRLYRGQEDQAKVYSEKPEEVARFFEGLGFSRLHVVDLDGAFGGVPRNLQAIRNIRKVFSGTIQVGGGIRSMETLKILDEEGINLFVVGTVALKNPQLFEEMLTAFPGRLILSVDSKGGKVSVGGWKEESPYTPQDLAKVWDQKPIWGYLYTVVERDGTLEGVDPKPYEEFRRVSKKPLLASGGVASLQDLEKLYGLVEGVVVGKAIYEGKIDLRELK